MPGYERFLVQIFITLIPVIGLYFYIKYTQTTHKNPIIFLYKKIKN